ncbi:hypothetical protein JXA59_01965 [Patescibacteria group bacterium]|nr:hypothetical protein [Patescibacteria group bacterium]
MKNTKKSNYNGFGLISLSVLFLLLYGYFNAVEGHLPSQSGNSGNTSIDQTINTVGAIGGFHLLESMECSDEQGYYRLALKTQLNRSTIIDQKIAVPLTKVTQLDSSEPTWINNKYQDTKNWGSHRLQVALSDTGIVDQTDGEKVLVFQGDKTLAVNQPPITTIQMIDSPDGTVNQILVGLNAEVKFRVSSTPTGTIYIDILK